MEAEKAPEPKVVIIGCGPTGLGSCIRFQEKGFKNWVAYEAESRPGGLASSEVDPQGFTWDIGGHVLFSHYEYFDKVLDQLGPAMTNGLRRCTIFLDPTQTADYPLQKNVHMCSQDVQFEILEGLLASHDRRLLNPEATPSNFLEWSRDILGDGITRIFMKPYNEKLWKVPMANMSASWLGERVAATDILDCAKSLIYKPDHTKEWGPNKTFKYPLHGGTGQIYDSLASALPQNNVRMNCRVRSIDPYAKKVYTDCGVESYDYLVSSVPLDILVNEMIPEDAALRSAVNELVYTSITVVGFGVSGKKPERVQSLNWAYFPSKDCPFFRCTVLSNSSPHVCPPGFVGYSLMLECTYNRDQPESSELSDQDLRTRCESVLREYGFIEEENVVVSFHRIVKKHGYPVPTNDRDKHIRVIKTKLDGHSILSRGRFGSWCYEVGNMDHSFMQGVEAADFIMQKWSGIDHGWACEPTLSDPDCVNSKKNEGNFVKW